MRIGEFFKFLLFLYLINSCTLLKKDSLDIVAKNLDLNPTDWKFIQKVSESKNNTFYYYENRKGDTTTTLQYYYFSRSDTFKLGCLRKEYEIDSLNYVVELNRNKDTLLFMSYLKDSVHFSYSSKKHFYKGKYYFLAEYGKLSLGQLQYYWKHKDSLIRVKGNDLPDLPEIEN